ncbi:hypothetical protein ACPCG0_05765 [Propionibacteriaceae bacterium Y1923]|uniref:hypothetical protein n=1 Tax=Aestuariimicrobium sp. Y1814 TaxID=3418742 RepID=UPI003C18D906
MKLRTRIAAIGTAAALLLSPVVTGSAQAQAPLAGPLVPAAAPSSQATAAANWIVDQWNADQSVLTGGNLADAIIGLAATGLHADVIDEMNAALQAQAPTYATSAGAAGKVAIAAIALGEDPTNYGGVDLIQVIQDDLAANPDAGGIFALPYAIIALVRAGETVPQASIDALIDAQDPSGAFGYWEVWNTPPTWATDIDSSGLAITALVGLADSGQGGTDVPLVLEYAVEWAYNTQLGDGSWAGYSPANATALVGQGLIAAGEDATAAQAYLHDQQANTGGAALPSTHDGTAPNMLATIQALLLLAGDDLLNVTFETSTPVTTPPVTTPPATTGAPTTSAPATTPNKPGALPNTGVAANQR